MGSTLISILLCIFSISCKPKHKRDISTLENVVSVDQFSHLKKEKLKDQEDQELGYHLCVKKDKELLVYLPIICVDQEKTDTLQLTSEDSDFIDFIIGAGIGILVTGSAIKAGSLFREGINTKNLVNDEINLKVKDYSDFNAEKMDFSNKKSLNYMNKYFDLRYGAKQDLPAAMGSQTVRIESLIKGFETRGITSEALGNLQKKIKSVEADEKSLTFCEVSITRRLQELEDLLPPPTKQINELKSSLKQLDGIRKTLEIRLGDYGRSQAAIAMSLQVRFAQFDNIAKSLKGSSITEESDLALKLEGALQRREIDISKMNLNPQQKIILESKLKDEPMAIISRGVSDAGYTKQFQGYAGKPVNLKMKSQKRTGFVPQKVEHTSKVPDGRRDEFTKLSEHSFDDVLTDGLPTSVLVPRTTWITDEFGQRHLLYEVALKGKNGKTILAGDGEVKSHWFSKQELERLGHDAEIIKYHGDPRQMPGSTEELLNAWKNDTSITKPTHGPDAAKSYAEFIAKKNGNVRTPEELMEQAPLYVADVDLLTMATKKSDASGKTIDLNKTYEGYIDESHEVLHRYRDVGFLKVGEKQQIKHGSELNNRSFVQRASESYPYSLIYTDRAGKISFELIEPGAKGNVHTNLFEKIKMIHEESNINVLINPAGMIKNIDDYKNLDPDLLIPEQKKLLADYFREMESAPKGMSKEEVEAAAEGVRRLTAS